MTARTRRSLGPAERWYWMTDQIAPLNVVDRVRLTGHLTDGMLTRAATNLAAEHPPLRVAIRAEVDLTNPSTIQGGDFIGRSRAVAGQVRRLDSRGGVGPARAVRALLCTSE